MFFRKIALVCCLFTSAVLAAPPALTQQIHSNLPAVKWEDAMVSGNGMTGVMVYGGQPDETFIFTNHKLLMPGNGRDPIPDMSDMVAPMREEMLKPGGIGKGWMLYWDEWKKRSGGGMFWTQQFHPGYQMKITFQGSYPVSYRRTTRFTTGEVVVEAEDGYGKWVRETFASRAQDIVVTRMKAPEGRTLDCFIDTMHCERAPNSVGMEKSSEKGWMNFRATYPKRGADHGGYEGWTRIVVKGERARQRPNKGRMRIDRADEILLITGIDRYREDFKEWDKLELKKRLGEVEADYDALLAEHVAIQKPMFERVTYDLGASEEDRAKSTEELLRDEIADRETISKALLERLFGVSRYLFMASSGEHYAPRLSGMFIGRWGAAWAGDYTLDANANMAVMGGHIGDMDECMRGYQAIIERTLPQWREGAKKLYGMRGILGPVRIDGEVAVPHHMSDYHAHPTATGLGPWIIYPLWERYEVTGDKNYLRETVYPLMKEQMDFYEDFLTIRDSNGKLTFVPSNSPENAWRGVKPRTSASINSTMDISAARQLMTNLLKAERDLGLPETETAKRLLTDLPPYLVNEDGALQEWSWPGHGEYYPHRHSSHMYVVWPGHDVHLESEETRDLVPAVIRALEMRDHSIIQAHDFIQRAIGWIRVKDGEQFYKILKYTLENNYLYSSFCTAHNREHDIYNYDYILSLQGMLMENAVFSRPGFIELLPAMPSALDAGEIKGMLARTQCRIDSVKWDLDAKTLSCTLTSNIDQTLTLMHRGGIGSFETKAQTAASKHGDHAREITLKAGESTTVELTW